MGRPALVPWNQGTSPSDLERDGCCNRKSPANRTVVFVSHADPDPPRLHDRAGSGHRALARRQARARAAAAGALTTLTLTDAAALVRARRVSAVGLTTACPVRIDTYHPKLNAFITVTRELALARARGARTENIEHI